MKPWEVGRSSEVGEKPGEDGAWKPGGGSGFRRGGQVGALGLARLVTLTRAGGSRGEGVSLPVLIPGG